MAIASAPYYFARCDTCGRTADYDNNITALETPGYALQYPLDAGWGQEGDALLCPDCTEDRELLQPVLLRPVTAEEEQAGAAW